MQASFETFDHTADLGIRVRAASLPEIIDPATRALYSAIGDLVAAEPRHPRNIELTGADPAEMLRDYLAELLFWFERDHEFATDADVQAFTPERLRVTLTMHRVDDETSGFDREVKAVTYHELSVRPIDQGFEACFIVDI